MSRRRQKILLWAALAALVQFFVTTCVGVYMIFQHLKFDYSFVSGLAAVLVAAPIHMGQVVVFLYVRQKLKESASVVKPDVVAPEVAGCMP